MDLLELTQAFFMLGFVAMAAGTFYFFMERNDLKPEHRTTATYAAVITFVASIMYWVMKGLVNFADGAATAADVESTMPIRYIDWLITTPLLLVEFGLIVALAGAAKKGFVTTLVVADLVMIATGYLGEVGKDAGSAANWFFFIVSTAAWLFIVWQVFQVNVSGGSAVVQQAVKTMRLFVVVGWAIYPVGTFTQEIMEGSGQDVAKAASIAAIIYVIADVLNKVGFGMVAVRAAKQS